MAEIPKIEVEFTKDGQLFGGNQVDAVLSASPQFSDLIVFSHGWNNVRRMPVPVRAIFLEGPGRAGRRDCA